MRKSGRRGRGGVVLAAAVLLAGTPGVASAAEDPPLRPLAEDLRTGGAACAHGQDTPYVPEKPQLEVVLRDPDPWARLGAEFEVWWTDAEGAERRETLTTTVKTVGTPVRLTPSFDVPGDTPVSWRVRAVGPQGAVSPWSDEEGGHACRFVVDATRPEAPAVTSDRYDDTTWWDGVGVYGGFTFDSPSNDVVAYRYHFIGGTERTVEPEELGGAATVRFAPSKSGTDYLTVRATDRAGNTSAESVLWFRVAEGRAPVAHWKLADEAAETGPALRAEDGVTFQDTAPYGTGLDGSARLGGAGNGYLTTDEPVVDTRKTYAVGGWVRPGRTDRAMTVASQDAADGTSAFTLGLRPTADGDADWAFGFGGATVTGGGPETGDWAHVLGVFDAEDDTVRLYVDGRQVGEKAKAAPVASPGAFQLGRARGDGGNRWHGDLADVRVWDRVVVPEEAEKLGRQEPQRVGGWDFESVTDDAAPGSEGGPLTLHEGAEVYRYVDDWDCWLDPECVPARFALKGNAHLALDGTTGHATAGGPVVETGGSYTVGAYVRFAEAAPDEPMTVLSQGGGHGDAFQVRYDPATEKWQLVVTHGDTAGAARTMVSQYARPSYGEPADQEIVVVHDDAADRITLYVDGEGGEATSASFDSAWAAEGPLQVGRGRTADGWGEYFHGAVDNVRVFTGALTRDDIWRAMQ
ncbi:LamG-like jellyroll fold domain-containing protein [Streptomyces sp. NPDC002640]